MLLYDRFLAQSLYRYLSVPMPGSGYIKFAFFFYSENPLEKVEREKEEKGYHFIVKWMKKFFFSERHEKIDKHKFSFFFICSFCFLFKSDGLADGESYCKDVESIVKRTIS